MKALERQFSAALCIGPPTSSGFYYDCVLPDGRPIREEDLETVEEFVKLIINEKQPFERLVLSKEQALKIFAYNKYKVTIIFLKSKVVSSTSYLKGRNYFNQSP